MRAAALVGTAVACLSMDVFAQSMGAGCNSYYPIRSQGSACYGPNVGWSMTRPDGVVVCCIGQPRSSTSPGASGSGFSGPSEQQRIAAGLALGIEGVALLADILNLVMTMADRGAPETTTPPRTIPGLAEQEARVRAERAEGMEGARILNAGGLEAARAGNYRTAYGNFKRAADMADAVNGSSLDYRRNMYAMDAYLSLQEGLALWAEGNRFEGMRSLHQAHELARRAGREDIASRISAYRTQLMKDAKAAPAQSGKAPQRAPSTQCMNVNGEQICD